MDSLRALEYQLEQASASLRADPTNERLRALETKLKALIQMSSAGSDSDPDAEEAAARPAAVEPVKTVEVAAGELCEARLQREGGGWWEATVQSVSPDRLSCTVIFTGGSAQHCAANMVKRHHPQYTKRLSRPEKRPERPQQPACAPPPPPPPASAPPGGGTGPVRRKHTLKEHQQKKEAEHAAKQDSWRSFSQKMNKKP